MALKHYKIKWMIASEIKSWGWVGGRCVLYSQFKGQGKGVRP
ncbi:hypothetical protein CrV_gp110 [Cylindrospermopsis raciborskii virus RM-2018a]|nr:hypothetical protein CrV_gp081 [Cylindrospermopsis raciborskii virus RM-2018a]AXK90520.1 hypothetical protein CrV_gp110 [Cylindrospermopsis raciborskii virus RM-2018a]WHL30653.1 hypothetical protein CrLKS4_g87 [Cylindrospermopsis phage Cr-LKS4]WHL30677.1 hypothetical protein CrLKS4_g111 [Cylindrospermopsis phage Cr-LKS4]